jgi:hypothetical protein
MAVTVALADLVGVELTAAMAVMAVMAQMAAIYIFYT